MIHAAAPPPGPPRSPRQRGRLAELALLFARLGFTSFGGPAAHVALMEQEVVRRRKWLDEAHFMDMVSAVNFVPGPNATELAIHVGQLRAGTAGLVVAGACFIVPAMLISIPLAWAYVAWGALPQAAPALRAIGAAIVAVVAAATVRFGRTAARSAFGVTVAAGAAAASFALSRYGRIQPEIPLLLAAALLGAARGAARRGGGGRGARTLALALPALFWGETGRMALILLKIGATLFGSGYVLISYLQSELVDRAGWLTQAQLVDAIAVGQFTPGPLLSSATFVGYLLGSLRFGGGVAGGVIAAVLATAAIFFPSFLVVAFFGPMLQKVRSLGWARGALDAMNAAVVGLMATAAVRLGVSALLVPGTPRADLLGVALFAASLLALRARVNSTWIVVAAGAIGTALSLLRP
jgi:chromate transporter